MEMGKRKTKKRRADRTTELRPFTNVSGDCGTLIVQYLSVTDTCKLMATSKRVKFFATRALSLQRDNDALPCQYSRRKATEILKMIAKRCPHIETFFAANSNNALMRFHKCGAGIKSYSLYDLSRTEVARSLRTAHFVISYVRNPDFLLFRRPDQKFPSLKNLTLHFADDMQYLPQFSQAVRNVNMWSHVPRVAVRFQMSSPVFTTMHMQALSSLSLTSLREISLKFPRRLRYDKNGASLRNFAGTHAHIPQCLEKLTVTISGSLYARTSRRFWEKFFKTFEDNLKHRFPRVSSQTDLLPSRCRRTYDFHCEITL